jgi:hypothetical protein
MAPIAQVNLKANAALLVLLLASACATQPKPEISSVCVEIRDMPEHETSYMLKHTAEYLKEYRFSQVTSGCEVVVRFQPFGKFQGEVVGPFGAKSGYWSQEGSVTVIRSGAIIREDEPISVRGQETRQDALDATAWLVVKPITKSFQARPR